MGGGRAGTGVAAMEGGVLVPAHTRGFQCRVSAQRYNNSKKDRGMSLFLLFIFQIREDFSFTSSGLELSSFDTNANCANRPVTTTFQCDVQRPSENLSPDVPSVLFQRDTVF